MNLRKLGIAGLAIGLGLGVAGCTDGYGYGGVGYASDGYYNDGYYGGGYDDGYYGPGYGGFGYGWFGDYYYPGSGVYVYDRYRRPYRWNDGQRRYWQGRGGGHGNGGNGSPNWGGFHHEGAGDRSGYRQHYQGARGGYQGNRGAQTQPAPAQQPQGTRSSGARGGYRGGGNHGGHHR